MREIKYTPKECEEQEEIVDGKAVKVPAKFSGFVVMKSPKYADYMRLIAKLESKGDFSKMSKADQMLILADLSEDLPKYIQSVELVRVKDKKNFSQYPDLENEPECYGIVSDLCAQLLAGFKTQGEAQPS